MARYIDVEGYRKLFDEEYKKTRKLISEGETHLDNLAEGFSEAGRVIDRMPTADVVPRSEQFRKMFDNTQILLRHLKQEIHDKAVYPNCHGVEPYISLKVFDAVINKLIGS